MIVRKSDLLRRTALLLAVLISGGSLLFPRMAILGVIVLLCLLARQWVLDLRRELMPVLMLLFAILVVAMLRPEGADFQSTAIRFANFLAGLLMLDLYLKAGKEALLEDLFVVLHLMAWQALITVLLAQFFNFLFIPLPVAETPYNTFLLLFNYHVMLEESTSIFRPDGFFYEPGVFQIYLNVFLYLALFIFRRPMKVWIALAAVLSTQSTTGYLICVLIIGSYVATRYLNRGSLPARVLKGAMATVFLAGLMIVAYVNISQKLTGDSQGSFWARQYDLLTGLNVIAQNPLLGIGFDYDQYYRASSQLGYSDTLLPERIIRDRGNSNGIIFLLYSLGIPLAVPFLVGLYRQRFFPDRFLIGTVLFLAFFGESVIYTPFFLMIVFSGLTLPARSPRIPEMVRER